jgi:putative SOS response-associated peptidase YedK
MCGRYALSKLPSELVEEFEIHTSESLKNLLALPALPADWNITPTRNIYIIREADKSRELAIASWGLIAPWSKSREEAVKSQSQAINARSETVDQKPTFRSAFRSRRCLIPADGYYEWATENGDFPLKQPFYISRQDRRTMAFAGIWESWVDPDGEVRESAALITRPAVEGLAKIHSRMPTFLPEDRWDIWLDRSLRDANEIRALMELEQPAFGLAAVPVSTAVNSIRNNGAHLIKEVDLDDHLTLF